MSGNQGQKKGKQLIIGREWGGGGEAMGILGKADRKGASWHSNVSSKRTRTGIILVPSQVSSAWSHAWQGVAGQSPLHMNEGTKVEEYGGAGTEARRQDLHVVLAETEANFPICCAICFCKTEKVIHCQGTLSRGVLRPWNSGQFSQGQFYPHFPTLWECLAMSEDASYYHNQGEEGTTSISWCC